MKPSAPLRLCGYSLPRPNTTPGDCMTRSNARSLRLAFAGCALLFSTRAVVGQAPASTTASQRPLAASPYFSATDALDINTFAVGDLSDDGKWLALTQSVRRDGYGTDYRHDGDPTYVKPTPVRLWAVDAHTGQRQADLPRQATCPRDAVVARRQPARLSCLQRRRLRAHHLVASDGQSDDAQAAGGEVRGRNERHSLDEEGGAGGGRGPHDGMAQEGARHLRADHRRSGLRPEQQGSLPRLGRPAPHGQSAQRRRAGREDRRVSGAGPGSDAQQLHPRR